ncbi:MAG: 3-deoxy-8-phosphooctulonate synthase, partial [Planctomycetia bacterium]
MGSKVVEVAQWKIGPGNPLLWILGPCVIESRELVLSVADHLASMASRMKIQVVFKSSFDKANRSSGKTFRGPG